jgi:transposase
LSSFSVLTWASVGQLLAVHVTAAHEQDRAQVGELVRQVQAVTGDRITLASVDAAYAGEAPAKAAAERGLSPCRRSNGGFVSLPRRRVVERSFGWMERSCRLARDEPCAHRMEVAT